MVYWHTGSSPETLEGFVTGSVGPERADSHSSTINFRVSLVYIMHSLEGFMLNGILGFFFRFSLFKLLFLVLVILVYSPNF